MDGGLGGVVWGCRNGKSKLEREGDGQKVGCEALRSQRSLSYVNGKLSGIDSHLSATSRDSFGCHSAGQGRDVPGI